jgi:hypothetical protein
LPARHTGALGRIRVIIEIQKRKFTNRVDRQ